MDALLLGEEAEIEVTYARKCVTYGKIVKLLSKSPDRIQPLCPVSTACGGCAFQNASYEYEFRYKKHKVEEDLKRIGHLENIKVNDVIGMDEPSHYRNKIQVPFGKENKHVIYGFYKANTHKIIPIKEWKKLKKEKNIIKKIVSVHANLYKYFLLSEFFFC